MVLVKTGSIGLKVAKVLDREADVFVHLSGKLKTWDTAGPAAVALGGQLDVGRLDGDGLPYDLSNVRQECSVIMGRPGALLWARKHLERASKVNCRKMALITKEADLQALCDKLAKTDRCAIDLEFVPERTYEPVLCLVQVATEDGAHLVDPIALPNLSQLWEMINREGMLVILHSGGQDLELIYSLSGTVPKNVFDTQIAAGFGGFGYPIGYGKLLHQLLGVAIAKTESYTDWTTRPLSDSQIQYAIEDVLHLSPMYESLTARLKDVGRLEWALEECARLSNPDRFKRDKAQDFLRVKGASSSNAAGWQYFSPYANGATTKRAD